MKIQSGASGPVGALVRRQVVAGMVLVPMLATAACGKTAPAKGVSLPDFRQPSDPDDTAALARAFATGKPVHAPAGRGSGSDGRYLVGNDASASLPSGATLSGDGLDKTIFARSDVRKSPFILHCDSGSPDPARNITGLCFRDLSFVDDVARLGFSEFSYLVMLNGVSEVHFDRVGFRGFRGDGLHLGSSVTARVERHNRGITVSDCIFDGVNANNRNAISVIDVDGLIVEASRFINVTRRGDGSAGAGDPMNPATGLGQPGAIDLEPNGDAFAIVRNVTIRNNRFTGGGGFAVALLLSSNDVLRNAQRNILIERNVIRDRAGGFEAFGFAGNAAMTSNRAYNIMIRNNQVERCDKPFIISGIRAITIVGNQFRDCHGHAELGYLTANAQAVVADNLFERVGGLVPGYALWIREGQDINLVGNRFIDAGIPGGRDGVAIAVVAGTVRGLTMRANTFQNVEGRTGQAVQVFREAKVDQASLRIEGNGALGVPLAQALNPPR